MRRLDLGDHEPAPRMTEPTHSDVAFSDDALAHSLARAAGELLRDLRLSGALAGSGLGDAGDEIANVFLVRALAAQRPEEAVLSEESLDDRARLSRRAVWIVDPLDGTCEYGEDRDDFAVHVALSIGGEAIVGAVDLPGVGATYSTWQPARPASPVRSRRLIVVSRTHPPPFADRLAELLDAEVQELGSMGAKAMAVVRGSADAYVHAGGTTNGTLPLPWRLPGTSGSTCPTSMDGRSASTSRTRASADFSSAARSLPRRAWPRLRRSLSSVIGGLVCRSPPADGDALDRTIGEPRPMWMPMSHCRPRVATVTRADAFRRRRPSERRLALTTRTRRTAL